MLTEIPRGGDPEDAARPDPHPASLTGGWSRVEPAAAGIARYAAQLEFQPGGLYRGQAATPGEFTPWDLGTWRVTADGGVLSLSTATDEVVDYRFAQQEDRLTITDQDGCTVEYRRTP